MLGLAFLRGSEAWSVDGHAAIAVIADSLVSPEVSKVLLSELGKESLEQAAIWCDGYDHTDDGRWSAALHFIDYPGTACSFDWDRDCKKDWCVTGALVNYTKQVWDTSISTDARLMALNFIIHMMGDLHQPLHVSSIADHGANDIKVDYEFNASSEKLNDTLHLVWDGAIVIQMIYDLSAKNLRAGPPPFHEYKKLADYLTGRVNSDWSNNATAWKSSVAVARGDETKLRAGLTTIAGETAGLGCEWGYTGTAAQRIKSGDLLDVQYYQTRKPIAAMQMAKAGVRLAQLLSESLVAFRSNAILFM